jgi:hypothetical protein
MIHDLCSELYSSLRSSIAPEVVMSEQETELLLSFIEGQSSSAAQVELQNSAGWTEFIQRVSQEFVSRAETRPELLTDFFKSISIIRPVATRKGIAL